MVNGVRGQAMLLSHDVIAHEVYSEQSLAVRASQSPVGQFTNGVGGVATTTSGVVSAIASDPGAELADPSEPDMEMDNVTRVRLVQFQKNSDEPMVSVLAVILMIMMNYDNSMSDLLYTSSHLLFRFLMLSCVYLYCS